MALDRNWLCRGDRHTGEIFHAAVDGGIVFVFGDQSRASISSANAVAVDCIDHRRNVDDTSVHLEFASWLGDVSARGGGCGSAGGKISLEQPARFLGRTI